MSYSFNWDCTLPIENIHDIVSINIVPETKAYNEGDYLSIRGHILIEGEYVSSMGNKSDFNESIPMDITLPNTGRNGDIRVDVNNFDYDIQDDEKLCLELNLSIVGYDLDSIPTLVEESVQAPAEQAPVLFTKEAAVSHPIAKEIVAEEDEDDDHQSAFMDTDDVEYLDFDDLAMPSNQEAIELVDEEDNDEDDRKEKLSDKIKQIVTPKPAVEQVIVEEEPVEEVIVEVAPVDEVIIETQPEEVVVEVAPVVETIKPTKPVMPIPVIETVVEEQPVGEFVVVEAEPIEEVMIEVEEVIIEAPSMSEMVTPIVKPKPVMPIPVVAPVIETVVEEQPVEEVLVEEEEVLPFPLKSQVVVEEPVTAKVVEKSDIFDMLYELDEEEEIIEIEEEPVTIVESVVTEPIAIQSIEEEPVIEIPVVEPAIEEAQEVSVSQSPFDESIASQFADGESIIKIVFVQEEETTVTDLCTKYSVTEENIYNCDNLTSPLCQGDRVMINYGSYRGR